MWLLAKGAAGAGQERLRPLSGGGRWCISCRKVKTQRQMAGWIRFSTCRPRGTAEYSRMRPQSNMPTEADRLAQGWCESCVRGRGGCVRGRGRAACVDVARISLTEGGRTGWGTSRFNATRLAQGWCKKSRVKTRWLRMWTWPDSSSVKEDVQSNQRYRNLTTALDFAFKSFERRDGGRRRS